MTVPLSLSLDSLATVCVDIYMHVRVFFGGLWSFLFLNDEMIDEVICRITEEMHRIK